MKTNKDAFGNRMKDYEAQTCGIKMMPRIPVIARLEIFSKELQYIL